MNCIFGKSSPFYGISDDAANYLLMNGNYLIIERGNILYREGDYVDGYYAVLEGEIHLQYKSDSDIQHALWPYRKGQWLANVHHFAGLPAPTDAVACEKSKLLHVSTVLSNSLFRKHPELYEAVLKEITKEYVKFAEYHKCTVGSNLKSRISHQLKIMAIRSNSYEISCTHAELAKFVGATREAVGTQLKKMEKEGLITIRYRKIKIMSPMCKGSSAEQNDYTGRLNCLKPTQIS